ncbi:hypothetical protein LINGRAHAP2_LOCUS25155 [Linum grandiflorum]
MQLFRVTQVSLLFRRSLSLCFYSNLANTIKAMKGCFGFLISSNEIKQLINYCTR